MLKTLRVGLYLFFCLNTVVSGQSSTLIPFSLEDQFDLTYTNATFKGFYVILVAGDRKGSEYSFTWSDIIKKELAKKQLERKTKVLGVANLQSAPSAFRSIIKSKFPSEKKYWVLLDWKGIFNEAYQFKEDVANIIIFNPDGRKIYSTSATDADDDVLNQIISVIREDAK